MNNKSKEQIVMLFSTKKLLTYKDLKIALSEDILNELKSITLIEMNSSGKLIKLHYKIDSSKKYINYNNHKFVETDTFSLTEEGENMLYQIKRDKEILLWAKCAAITGIAGLLITILGLFK